MESQKDLEKLLKEKEAALWAACYPRAYSSHGSYGSPKSIAIDMAMQITGHRSMGPAVDNPTKYAALTSYRLLQHSVPTYFVAPTLLHACLETSPPDQFNYNDLRWPMPAMLFVLPKGALKSPSDGDCEFIGIARHSTTWNGQSIPGLGHGKKLVEEECLSYFTCTSNGMTFGGYAPTIENLALSEMLSGERRNSMGYIGNSATGEPLFESLSATDDKFLRFIEDIALRLLLILNARPELVSPAKELRKAQITAKKSMVAIWTPNIIGENYRANYGEASTAPRSASSPRMHWRRGHYRSQPFGMGLTQRRITWIEPVLVNAE